MITYVSTGLCLIKAMELLGAKQSKEELN